MQKIRLFFAASLDGFIADPHGGVAFLDPFNDDPSYYEKLMSSVDTLVMGRGTYTFVETYGEWPYGAIRTIVLTHRPIENPLIPDMQTRAIEDFGAFAAELRRGAKGDVWIVGGGQIMAEFLAAGEVDSIEMSIVPVAIGAGIPMYAGRQATLQPFELRDCSRSPDGMVHLVYERC